METADHITGQVAGAMVFDGSNEYIDTNFTEKVSDSAHTINIWVKDIPSGNTYVVCQHDAAYSSDFILGYQNVGLVVSPPAGVAAVRLLYPSEK